MTSSSEGFFDFLPKHSTCQSLSVFAPTRPVRSSKLLAAQIAEESINKVELSLLYPHPFPFIESKNPFTVSKVVYPARTSTPNIEANLAHTPAIVPFMAASTK